MEIRVDKEHNHNPASYLRLISEVEIAAGNIHERLYGVVKHPRFRRITVMS